MTQHNIAFSQVPRLHEVASHIVQRCLRVKERELVQVIGGVHQYWLLSQISLEIRKAGAHPLLDITDDEAIVNRVNEIPKHYLGQRHPALKAVEDQADVRLVIYPIFDPVVQKRQDPQRLALTHRDSDSKEQRKTRCLGMEWPTPAKAKIYGFAPEEFRELYWRAFWVDLDALWQTARVLKEKLQGARKVIITSCDDSTLTLEIGARPVWVDTGSFSEELMAAGDLTKNLPCGEVYCSPIEESANGTVFFQNVFTQGQWIRNLHVTFENGTVTQIKADEGAQLFTNILSQHTGDKDRIAELGIGINPHVPRVMGNTLLDEKVVGSIHIAIGRNTMYGGINKSSLHWDLISMNPTVVADGDKVMTERTLHLE